MKNILRIFTFIFFTNFGLAQSKCPSDALLGKWIGENFGIEITCDKFVILDSANNWIISQKKSDSYYILEPILQNEKEIFITWVQNYAMYDFYSEGTWHKTTSRQQRIFKIELRGENKIKFSMSEKKIDPDGLHPYASVNIIKRDQVFEKSFLLTKLE